MCTKCAGPICTPVAWVSGPSLAHWSMVLTPEQKCMLPRVHGLERRAQPAPRPQLLPGAHMYTATRQREAMGTAAADGDGGEESAGIGALLDCAAQRVAERGHRHTEGFVRHVPRPLHSGTAHPALQGRFKVCNIFFLHACSADGTWVPKGVGARLPKV